MTQASAPTLLIEPTSAWVVILAVSLVTLPAVLLARKAMKGGGGAAASVLLTLPLALPLLAALLYERGVFPEIAVLRPVLLKELGQDPGNLEHLLFMSDGKNALVPYLLSSSVGGLIVLIGASISAFMLARRLAGRIKLARLVRRCSAPDGAEGKRVEGMVSLLAGAAELKRVPQVLVLPGWACGAFAVGGRQARILISRDLLEVLDDDELEAVLAHEVAHVAARDMQVVAWAGLLRDMTAWNPLSHVALRSLHRDRELEADRRAASLTGKPLAVASGLIKMCDLLRARPERKPRAALAMLRRRDGVVFRVNNLLALSDGGGAVAVRGRVPFVIAGFLVVALALQVGAVISSMRGSTFAIVLGSTDADGAEVWSQPRQKSAQQARSRAGHGGRAGAKRGHALISPLAAGIAVRQDDLWGWLRAVQRRANHGLKGGRRVLQQVRSGWQALPVMTAGNVGPFGIYRVEPAFTTPSPPVVPRLKDDVEKAAKT